MRDARPISRDKPLHRPLRPLQPQPPVREGFDWAAAGWAGLVAGIVLIASETLMIKLAGGGVSPIRQIAAIALGESALPEPTSHTAIVYLAAMAVHLPLSLLYARILAVFIERRAMPNALAAGVLFGAGLYGLNYYVFSEIFPWFAPARNWGTLLSHLLFGLVAAGVYKLERQSSRRSS
ncbi:MAG: hypothetical protein HYZ74_05455 [Elusimicrobia bacterium]|nr:hypothetical protein [Elusimicrobiota bacterium]